VTTESPKSTLLDDDALDYLRRRGQEVRYREADVILKRGETKAAFWVILSGEVEVVVRSNDEREHSLLRLGPGESFGELAILRSAPVAADVVAITPVTLLRYPGEYLPTALAECEALRHSLLSRMAHSVHRTTSQALGLYRQTQALTNLYQGVLSDSAMIGNSARMRAVIAHIHEASKSRLPILISGEFGTGKLLAARMIHANAGDEIAPLIAVDCRELSARDANALLFGTASASDADLSAERFGALHLAHNGTLVLRGIEALNDETQRELARHLQANKEVSFTPFPDVRFIATVDTNAQVTSESPVAPELTAQLEFVIKIPTLAERPRDILPLARSFLYAIDHTDRLGLTPSAEQALVSLKYRQRNVAELRSVIELAARVADGNEIRAEHIFSGFDSERPIGFDVSDFWLVRWLVDRGGVQISRLAVAVFFVFTAAVCFLAGQSMIATTGNAAVWMLWEPAVFGLFLLVGTVWCTVCPLSSGGRAAQRLFSFQRPPPAWILRFGTWLSAAGLVLILWAEEFFHMAVRPLATGWLLLALVLSAVICCVIWQREVWCRHLCPLGRLGVALSPVAPLTVAARRSVCASTCTTHDCYKGNERIPGCPVWHHPQLVSEAHRCKTCLTCLQSCPHGSAGLYLRPRLRSAWRLVSTESYIVPFALTVFFLAPVLILIQRGGVLSAPLWLTLSCWITLAAAAIASPLLSPLVQREGRTTALAAAVACALLVLGWGPLMAYQMGHIPFLESLVVVADPDTWWARWPGPALTVMTLVRVAWVVFAAILSATILWNANGAARKVGVSIRTPGWTLLIVVCTVYTFGALWLVS
jgi:CRP-like cAMP-binding protein/polyferredoxin